MPQRSIRVAALQLESKNGDVEGNLARASVHVAEAARRGAQLVLAPELLAAGYLLTEALWDGAEPTRGPTVRWLEGEARRHGIFLGASFLEASGEDFFNTFVLCGPSGDERGRVRKETPALFETYFTRGDVGPHVITTELGVLGVGICYENQLAFLPERFTSGDVDLVLMPHSAPSPPPSAVLGDAFVRVFEDALRSLPGFYAGALGVPVVLANKCGPWTSPLPGLPFMTQRSRFPGLSAIADAHGTVLASLCSDEGVIVESVTLDPAQKTRSCPPCRGRWARAMPMSAAFARVPEALGTRWYARSTKRRERARAASAGDSRARRP